MSQLPEVALHCACGGRLVITGLTSPSQMVDVLTLVGRFEKVHKDHGTAGVREPRSPSPLHAGSGAAVVGGRLV